MYRTTAERDRLWERDQIHFAEVAHQYACMDVPTIGMCLACKVEEGHCPEKIELLKELERNGYGKNQ